MNNKPCTDSSGTLRCLHTTHLSTQYQPWYQHCINKLPIAAGHEGRVTGLALLPDWTLASVSHDRTIRLWDLHTFRLLKTVKDAHETPLQGIDYSPHREELVTWAMDNFAYVWDAVTLSTKYALVGHSAEVTQVSVCRGHASQCLQRSHRSAIAMQHWWRFALWRGQPVPVMQKAVGPLAQHRLCIHSEKFEVCMSTPDMCAAACRCTSH